MAPVRYRCAACGNLTRFDVTTTRRTRAYHHYSLSGELSVEEPEVLHEVVDDVSCRWCASGRAVEVLSPGLPAVAEAPDGGDTDAGTGADVAPFGPEGAAGSRRSGA